MWVIAILLHIVRMDPILLRFDRILGFGRSLPCTIHFGRDLAGHLVASPLLCRRALSGTVVR